MGLIVNVFKDGDVDCTNRGISSNAKQLCLVNVSGPFEPSRHAPAAMLVKGNAPGLAKIVPAGLYGTEWKPATGWWMMGGNFAYTSDSRFPRAVEAITGHPSFGAVPIHDRQE